MRLNLTPAFVKKANAKAGADRTLYWDAGLKGFGLMITETGHRSWVVQYRANGISRRYTIDGKLSLAKARKRAKQVQGLVAHGGDPVKEERKKKAEAQNTLKAIAEEYLRREEKKRELRSLRERRRIFERYLYPKLGERQIDSIKRSEITRLLDHIEDDNGPVMADHVLAMLRKLMNWHASRGDDFRSPIVRGMTKTKPKDRARERILSDEELMEAWRTAEKFPGPYGYLVRFILLTATRINEAARMARDELSPDGTDWVIPGSRHKSKRDFLLPLSKAAQDLLEEIPTIGRKGWVFTTNGDAPISGFSKWKATFDAEMAAELRKRNAETELQHWVVHDLRRTARSLMSRAWVSPDHAERALGHLIGGVRGTYDRYEFKAEKAQAFEALALQIARILDPQEKVVALRGAR